MAKLAREWGGRYRNLLLVLLASNGLSLALFLARVSDAGNVRYWFLLWNLVLGWLPLVFAVWLVKRLRKSSWLIWQNIALTLLWMGLLPNSFYLLSDLIHLDITGEVSVLYDAVMFMSFIFNAYVVGFMSVYLIHRALLERVRRRDAHFVIGGVFLACGFAIYLGRYLRWNSWDVLLSPAGLIFDVSDKIINPSSNPQAFATTVTFFALLCSMYAVGWQLIATVRNKQP